MQTELCRRVGIDHPVILAPMAGATDAALVSAVAQAGGLGSHGCAATPPASLPGEIAGIRGATNRPFNLNFFVHSPPRMDAEREARLQGLLQPLFNELDLGPVPAAADLLPPFGPDHLDALLSDPPPIVSFHFGLPPPDLLQPLRDKGCLILSSATTVAEAKWLEANGCDVIIAQGAEAGGHRGTFLDEDYGAALIGTLALVPQVVDAVDVPVIAAGGIADGRGVAAALALGAGAAQVGTAFLRCDEAPTDPTYRQVLAVAAAGGADTVVTKTFSGRPARAVRNRYVEVLGADEDRLPDFPLPYLMNAALRRAAAEQGRTDLPACWAGQSVALSGTGPAGALVERLAADAADILQQLAG